MKFKEKLRVPLGFFNQSPKHIIEFYWNTSFIELINMNECDLEAILDLLAKEELHPEPCICTTHPLTLGHSHLSSITKTFLAV
ncbi:hypothetical protein RRG08_034567 [Elysia crispata]|uniref:Uncharacterized protein n=1 Tax=Elysia crispata TaxID=231223 RepID=A0AAE1B335_9GAST|nr:hypothetical protein RRG08_034567 [Elysia crispata]